MGMEQLDQLTDSSTALKALIIAGKTEQALALITGLDELIITEKRKIAGEGNTNYPYVCRGCSLKCKTVIKFSAGLTYRSDCILDGKKDIAVFEQKEIETVKT